MKPFLATLIGIVGASMTMMGIESLGHAWYPINVVVGIKDLSEIPSGLYVTILVAHAVGLIVGLILAKLIDRETPYPIYIIAGFLFFGSVTNLFMIPHPTWFTILDLLIMLIIGGLIVVKTVKSFAK
jgi:hypothetical protein